MLGTKYVMLSFDIDQHFQIIGTKQTKKLR